MLVLVGVSVVKAVFLGFLAWRQARFVSQLQTNLSQRLFAGYLRQPYTFHLQRNSAQLIFDTSSQSAGDADINEFLGALRNAKDDVWHKL
jgi:hypothetical protein